jgi:hypothetical protein
LVERAVRLRTLEKAHLLDWALKLLTAVFLILAVRSPIQEVWIAPSALAVIIIVQLFIIAPYSLYGDLFAKYSDLETQVSSRGRTVPSDAFASELKRFATEQALLIEIFAYSGETFHVPLNTFFSAVESSGKKPHSFSVRILLKHWGDGSFLPGCAPEASKAIQEEKKKYRENTTLANRRRGEELSRDMDEWSKKLNFQLEVRLYHVDPFHKGILINRKWALWNLYPMQKGIKRDQPNILDYQGKGVTFAEFRDDGTPSEVLALRSMCRWFDDVWNDCCSVFPAPAEDLKTKPHTQ